MTDWEKLKVTELKDELKARGIPLTGLKLKQQLIDKLIEIDTKSGAVSDQEESPDQGDKKAEIDAQSPEEPEAIPDNKTPPTPAANNAEPAVHDVSDTIKGIREDNEGPKALSTDDTAQAQRNARDALFIPEQTDETREEDHVKDVEEPPAAPVDETIDEAEDQSMTLDETSGLSHKDTAASTRLPTPDFLEDQRKRKRRSATPVPESQDIAYKKARTHSRDPIVTEKESMLLGNIQAATDEAQDGRAGNSPDEEPLQPMEASNDLQKTIVAKEIGGLPDALESWRDTSVEDNLPPKHDVDPAIHPVTSSLYIRNFKRPLHIATLRAFISNIAKPATSAQDPIKLFYLDNIRTHAFISFASSSAATQVRDAMHGTRYPDEQMRDPLWVDYIPDEKVQSWIDKETGHGGGFASGRGGGKYEVTYDHGRDGIEASLTDASGAPTRPILQQRPSRPSQDQRADPSTLGAHSERTPRTPQEQENSIRHRPSDVGKGFKALDELFPSTTTKPKLYYKQAPQAVVNDRLSMLRELRVGHSEMGRSGDEGMKRYTFETHKNKEEWVDKGPEFGFGKKGQDRLEGVRGRGGLRGGFRGIRRGADSWRGR